MVRTEVTEALLQVNRACNLRRRDFLDGVATYFMHMCGLKEAVAAVLSSWKMSSQCLFVACSWARKIDPT